MDRATEFDGTPDAVAQWLFGDTPPAPTLVSACRDCDLLNWKYVSGDMLIQFWKFRATSEAYLSEEDIIDLSQVPDDLDALPQSESFPLELNNFFRLRKLHPCSPT
jgi:hypothetical protein